MVTSRCPTLLIAGTQSGVGKTSLSIGLVRALTRRGLRVQPFKVGPDFLDPTYLALAAGRTCYNLDAWMCGERYVKRLLVEKTADADLAIIEGVMGLFDGPWPDRLEGSTGEVAAVLGAPVLLVADAHGAARSLAATVSGFCRFEPAVRIAGVLANRCGSEGHRGWLGESLRSADLPPLVGGVPRGAFPELRSRHLGLVTADRDVLTTEHLDQLADACAQHVDLDAVLSIARTAPAVQPEGETAPPRPRSVRLGIARDAAFHFYYADNLEALERAGCELVPFSPIGDGRLPERLDALYFGGGYPEEHAAALSANSAMREQVLAFARSGRPVYAECGGLMYLGRSLQTADGREHEMIGALPLRTRTLKRLRSLRYVEATLTADSLWGRAGESARGHEFHYSELADEPALPCVYALRRPRGESCGTEGYQVGRVLGSYVHLHWASRPAAIEHFVGMCKESGVGSNA